MMTLFFSSLLTKLKDLLKAINPLTWILLALAAYAAYNKRRADIAELQLKVNDDTKVVTEEKGKLNAIKEKRMAEQSNLDQFERDYESKWGHKPGK